MTIAASSWSHSLSGGVTIEDEDELYRIVTDEHINDDGSLKSNAFSGGTGEISVDIAKPTTPEVSVERLNKAGVKPAKFIAACPRSLNFEPRHDPQPGYYSHALLGGTHPKLPQSVRRKLARGCSIVQGYVSVGPATEIVD